MSLKLLCTSWFNNKSPIKLNKLIIKNRREYTKFHNYGIYGNFKSFSNELSWRHPYIIYESLLNKKFKKYDIIVNTGQRNIITNYNISIEDKMLCHLNPLKHNLLLQYWELNPMYMNFVPYTEYKNGPIKIKKIEEPYKIITAEWIQMINNDWSVRWYKELIEDERFKNKPLMNFISMGLPHYDIALTIKYNEDLEAQNKIALSPLNSYATFPLNDDEYSEKIKFETMFSLDKYMKQWKINDWAIGIPHPISDKITYEILKKYLKFVNKGN